MSYSKIETFDEKTTLQLSTHYQEILKLLGENPSREGLIKTPERVAKSMQFFLQGYQQDAKKILESALFESENSNLILVKDIDIFSMCEHHMVPFFGKAHIAYYPANHYVGLSKIPRIVDVFSRRLQVQERLTQEIIDTLNEVIKPIGIAVIVEAKHMCMAMRGVSKTNSKTITSAYYGNFNDEVKKSELLNMLHL